MQSPFQPCAGATFRHLRDLTRQQLKSGLAAWIEWCFDGLDIRLCALVYAQFVSQLLCATSTKDPSAVHHAALSGRLPARLGAGGGFFGRIGDHLGWSRTLSLTIRTALLKDGKAYVQAGGGWVNDSVPEAEFLETINKSKAMLKAVALPESFFEGVGLPPGFIG